MTQEFRADLTAEFVRSILDYDSETGVLNWRFRPTLPRKWNTRYAHQRAGTLNKVGYRWVQAGSRVPYAAHRLIWLWMTGEWPIHGIDHINGNRDDNRWANLRLATPSENGCNKTMQRNNQSGYVGVYFDRQRGKWRATINKDRTRHDLGFYSTPEEAAQVRKVFVNRIHGEYTPKDVDRSRYLHFRDLKKPTQD